MHYSIRWNELLTNTRYSCYRCSAFQLPKARYIVRPHSLSLPYARRFAYTPGLTETSRRFRTASSLLPRSEPDPARAPLQILTHFHVHAPVHFPEKSARPPNHSSEAAGRHSTPPFPYSLFLHSTKSWLILYFPNLRFYAPINDFCLPSFIPSLFALKPDWGEYEYETLAAKF